MTGILLVFMVLALFVFWVVAKTAVVVPQQNAYVVERLGRFAGVLDAGFHILVPFVDVIRYRHVLKEQAMDIPEQVCITRDNVQVAVDGILYLKVMDPERASYGISNYNFAITQLAQTTLRSEIGKIELDRTFEERTHINTQVVTEVDKASEAWGVKVLRYEIKNITPPADIIAAMEKQMRAEREKRAVILTSEGERDAAINSAEGHKQQVIKASEAKKQQQINEAEGQASAILAVAKATGEGIRSVAQAIQADGGFEAVQLRVAEQYVQQFGNIAKVGQHPGGARSPDRRGLDDLPGHERDPAQGRVAAAAHPTRPEMSRGVLRRTPARRSPPAFTRSEQRLVAALPTPLLVERWLRRLPYNYEKGGETLRTFRRVVRDHTAHCLEAALFAAAVLEAHGYPPLLMSLESLDQLDHVIFVYRKDGRWGSIGRSRDPGLHGRWPVFASPRALALSYMDQFVDKTGRLVGWAVADLRELGTLRLALRPPERLEGGAVAHRLRAPQGPHVRSPLPRVARALSALPRALRRQEAGLLRESPHLGG